MLLLLPLGVLADDCRKTQHVVFARVGEVDVEVEFYSSRIVRVKKVPRGEDVKWKSYSVVMSPTRVPFDFTVTAGDVTLATDSVKVSLDLQTGRVMFRSARNLLGQPQQAYLFTGNGCLVASCPSDRRCSTPPNDPGTAC